MFTLENVELQAKVSEEKSPIVLSETITVNILVSFLPIFIAFFCFSTLVSSG